MSVSLNRKYLKGFVDQQDYDKLRKAVEQADSNLSTKAAKGSEYLGWLTLPEDYDREEFEKIKSAAKQIRETSDVLIVIGIGGSYLGARAVIELLGSQSYNDFAPLKVFFT